jgi:transcription elongation factor Elf1
MKKYRCEQCDSEDLKTVTVALEGILLQCTNCGCTMEVQE